MSTVEVSRYAPVLASVGQARRSTQAWAYREGLADVGEDAALVVSELAANAVIHARTDFTVYLCGQDGGLRAEVCDACTTVPLPGALTQVGISGRGLSLVEALAAQWGVHVVDGGKCVWALLTPGAPAASEDATAEDLMEMWAGLGHDAARPAATCTPQEPSPTVVTVPDLPVADLVAAKAHMEDLLREMQLLLLHHPADSVRRSAGAGQRPAGGGQTEAEHAEGASQGALRVAAHLDAAARAVDSLRLQIRSQAQQAAGQGLDHVTLTLSIPSAQLPTVVGYRQALDEAAALADDAFLIGHTDALRRYAGIRRHYLDEIIDQLSDLP